MEWTELKFAVKNQFTDDASAIANMVTDYGIMIEDYSDMEDTLASMGWQGYIDEDLLAKDRSVSIIHIFLPPHADVEAAQEYIKERLDAIGAESEFSSEKSEEEDWSTAWKKFYHPFRVGDRIVVCPSWESFDAKDGDVVLKLDPGAAFGSGEHETTSLCLEVLDKVIKPGDRVLDMGCGSGILFISSLLLGAESAKAVDIDEMAVKTARENAVLNGLTEDKFKLYRGNVVADKDLRDEIGTGYDVITANIVADVLIAQAGLYYDSLKDDGTLVASGIIGERALEVQRKFEETGFEVVMRNEKRSWVSLVLKKK